MSSYIVLARKLRPQTFGEIAGQGYIVKALRGAARAGRLAHALLFTGARGVGKTSTARIVAKTVNCDRPSPGDRPCGENPCKSCALISDGRAVEVQEMDAASHTSVNDVRDIIEKSRYIPASGKTKIYIIDEAHMLSHAAFNALLKTLEEPPAHVLFILATTEPHKIPATILSRCQRYDFAKVSVTDIASSLESAAKGEKINIAPETTAAVALEADGSVRDGLSLLDQLIAAFGNEIKHAEALSLLGLADTNLMNEMFDAIMKRDAAKGLGALRRTFDKGVSPVKFAESLTALLRNSVVLKLSGEKSVLDISAERAALLLRAAQNHSAENLETLFDIAIETCDRVNRSFYPEMAAQAMVIRLCSIEKALPLDEIMSRLKKLTGSADGEKNQTAEKNGAKTENFKSEINRRENTQARESAGETYGISAERKDDSASETSGKISDEKISAELDGGSDEETDAEKFADFLQSGEEDFGYIAPLVSSCEVSLESSAAVIKIAKNSVLQNRLEAKKDIRERFLKSAGNFFGRPAKIEITETARRKNPNGIETLQDEPIVRQAIEMFDGKIKNLAGGKRNEI